MTEHDWHSGYARTLGVYLNGEGIPERDPLGARVVDDSFLLLFNAHYQRDDVHAAQRGVRADVAGRRRHRGPPAGPGGPQGTRRQAGWTAAHPGAVVAGAAAPVLTRPRSRAQAAVRLRRAGDGAVPSAVRPPPSGPRPGRRRRRRAARRRARRAARAPRSRDRSPYRGASAPPWTSRPSTSTRNGTPRDGGGGPRPRSAVRAGEQREACRRTGRVSSGGGPRAGPRRAGRARPGRAARSIRRSGAGSVPAITAERCVWPRLLGRPSVRRPCTSSERAAAASPTGPRSASWLASSASPARPRAAQASFQPSSWPSWIAVFRPIPATASSGGRRRRRGTRVRHGRSWRPRRPA